MNFKNKLKELAGGEWKRFTIGLINGEELLARITEVSEDFITLHLLRWDNGKKKTEVMLVPVNQIVRISRTFDGEF